MQISILIVTYNRARFIRAAVDSALSQDYPDLEVVVVDDGSTDDTAEIVAGLTDSRLRYVHKPNGGVSSARNRAIEEARGEFIIWLDSDDVLLPGTVAAYADALREHPECDIFYGHLRLMDQDDRATGEKRYRNYDPQDVIPALVHGGIAPQPGVFIRRSIFERIGTYDPDMAYAEDYDWFSRAAEFYRFKLVPRHTCGYRSHGDQLCGPANDTEVSLDIRVIQRMVERYGLPRLFPDLYQAPTSDSETGALFRLANVFHERTGHAEGEKTFADAVDNVIRSRPVSHAVKTEADKCLYQVALDDRSRYRRYARRCLGLWPGACSFWKHGLFSMMPARLHAVLRRR